MAYAAASNVAPYNGNILNGASNFTSSTCPTLVSVNNWLSSGCATIEMKLASCKYSVPPASGTIIYDFLAELNALYAAAKVEMSRTNVVLAPDERTRGQVFMEQFNEGLDSLCEMDLTSVGLSRANTGTLYVGGISVADKQAQEADTDRVQNRFGRRMHRFPGTIDPTTSTAS